MSEFGRNTMTKNPEPMDRGKIYEYDHEKADLVLAMQSIFDRAEKLAPPPRAAFEQIVQREPYSVSDKAGEIVRRLKSFGITRFLLLFRGARSRSEIVATFMAVLELCRNNLIKLRERDPSRGRRDRLHGGLRAGRTGNFYIVRNVWHWKQWTYMRSARRWRASSLPPASR